MACEPQLLSPTVSHGHIQSSPPQIFLKQGQEMHHGQLFRPCNAERIPHNVAENDKIILVEGNTLDAARHPLLVVETVRWMSDDNNS